MEEIVYLYHNKTKGGRKVECIYSKTDKLLTFKISEEIDQSTTDKIRRKIDNEITRFLPRKVIFDFSNISFMDSAGIGLLLGRYKIIKMLGGTLELSNVNRQIEKVLEISGILKIIPITKIENAS
jgi:stage II sporulation protein AA (anti-sigma F factor antagonist)